MKMGGLEDGEEREPQKACSRPGWGVESVSIWLLIQFAG